uniref:DDE_Tnp_IS1595 domain-containing protein n=1 Tax=Strongyloides papillosus TaxID=174720 RepID=A0A0N5B7R5_STREA
MLWPIAKKKSLCRRTPNEALHRAKNSVELQSQYLPQEDLLEKWNMKIGEPEKIVEIDESLISKRKNHCGRVLPPVWIFGGVCRETGECFLQAVPKRGFKTLTSVILERIEEGSTIYSDCWRSYKTSELEAQGFEHFRVNHKYNFVDPESGAHTQTVERMWGSAKWRNKKQRGTDRNMLDSYLAEFIWRKNNRKNDLFIKALQDIAAFWPPEVKIKKEEK